MLRARLNMYECKAMYNKNTVQSFLKNLILICFCLFEFVEHTKKEDKKKAEELIF